MAVRDARDEQETTRKMKKYQKDTTKQCFMHTLFEPEHPGIIIELFPGGRQPPLAVAAVGADAHSQQVQRVALPGAWANE